MKNKIVHIAYCEKFIPPFIEFIRANFDHENHEFLLTNGMAENHLIMNKRLHLTKRNSISYLFHYAKVIIKVQKAKKVILHGLFDQKLVALLFFMPWILKKCYWVMWGADLYSYQSPLNGWKSKLRECFRRKVIQNCGHFITHVRGDYELAQKWYGAKGDYQECFMYTTNLYKQYISKNEKNKSINVLVGNSADQSNNHLEIIDKLLNFKDLDIKLFVPLTYGDKLYADKIVSIGVGYFGERFVPIIEHLPFDSYLQLLSNIDIAIFNHKRQQAMGNTVTLLGLGIKVYMRNDTTQWSFFVDHDIDVHNIEDFSLEQVNRINVKNIDNIKEYFSEKNLVKQLHSIFNN